MTIGNNRKGKKQQKKKIYVYPSQCRKYFTQFDKNNTKYSKIITEELLTHSIPLHNKNYCDITNIVI